MQKSILAKIREKKGHTQTYMAEVLDISITAYHMYETGQRKIPSSIATRIAEILEVENDDIFLPFRFALRKTNKETA